MCLEFLPAFIGKTRLTINRFAQRFGARRTVRPLQPAMIQRLGDEFAVIGGNGGLLLFASGMADTDKEARQ